MRIHFCCFSDTATPENKHILQHLQWECNNLPPLRSFEGKGDDPFMVSCLKLFWLKPAWSTYSLTVKSRQTWVRIPAPLLIAVQSWTSDSTSPNFCFFIYKIGVVIQPASWDNGMIQKIYLRCLEYRKYSMNGCLDDSFGQIHLGSHTRGKILMWLQSGLWPWGAHKTQWPEVG